MFFINTATGQYPITEGAIRAEHPNTSFAALFVAPEPYAPVAETLYPEYDPITHTLEEEAPVQTEHGWVRKWAVVALPADVVTKNRQSAYNRAAAQARVNRNDLLKQSDWTQVVDAQVDQAAWAAYRQALRDISHQPGFPYSVIWPKQPD